ncbi:MAG: hypothetical protein WAM21_04315, partial [Steroidobacteraceae bacterium]
MLNKILFGVTSSLFAAGAAAADSPLATLSQILANSGITESGYVAASYYDSSGYNTYHQFDT